MSSDFSSHKDQTVCVLFKAIMLKLNEYTAAKDKLDSVVIPPDAKLLEAAKTSDVKSVKELYESYTKALSMAESLKTDVVKAMQDTHPKIDVTEQQDLKENSKNLKDYLVNALKALHGHAEHSKFEDVQKWATEELEKLTAKKTNSTRNPELSEMRKWLQENRPDLNVKDRGRIPEEAQFIYRNR